MLTIQAILSLPLFADAVLVAGHTGTDRPVRHVHVVDLPDPTFQWARGGELMLTTGYSLPHDSNTERHYIERLNELNLAGLVISVGHYMQHTPAALRQAADHCAFPVIELPSSVPFVDVTRELMGQIIDRQHTLNQRSNDIHRMLMDLVLDGRSLQEVADVIAEFLDRSITIENRAFEVLATTQVGQVDLARERSVARGQTSPELSRELIRQGIYQQLLVKRGPIYVSPKPEIGMHMERIVAPIIVANQITGYVWIIAGERRLNELDTRAIATASLVTALIMLRERTLRQKEEALRGDLLSHLLENPDPTNPELVELAHRSGFQMNLQYQVIALKAHDQVGEPADLDGLQRRLESSIDRRKLVVRREKVIVIVLQTHHAPAGASTAHAIFELLDHPTQVVLLGVGSPATTMSEIRQSFESAMEVLEVMELDEVYSGVHSFDALGMALWLRHIPERLLHQNWFFRQVVVLHKRDDDLYHTLFVYLGEDKNVGLTAQRLNIHRNTLAHRLRRIEELVGCSLDDAETCLNFYAALRAHRLRPQ